MTMKVHQQSRFSAVFLGLFSLGILVFAVPRFVASIYALYPESVLTHQQSTIPVEDYLTSIRDLDAALAWDNNPDYLQAKALCNLALVNSPAIPITQKYLQLFEARQMIIKGLKVSPIDGFAWYRFALVDKPLGHPVSEVAEALRLSLYSARVEPDLVMQRLTLAFSYLNELRIEDQALWLKEVPLAWKYAPNKLVAFVIQNPKAKSWVQIAFVYDIEHLDQFERAYEKAIKNIIPAPTH